MNAADQTETAAVAVMRCHRCGSASIDLFEMTEESHHWQEGLLLVDGEIVAKGEAVHTAGDIIRVRIRCTNCGHVWRPRRTVFGAADHHPLARHLATFDPHTTKEG